MDLSRRTERAKSHRLVSQGARLSQTAERLSVRMRDYLLGAGTVLDLGGNSAPEVKGGDWYSDSDALRHDFEKIGTEFSRVFYAHKRPTSR